MIGFLQRDTIASMGTFKDFLYGFLVMPAFGLCLAAVEPSLGA